MKIETSTFIVSSTEKKTVSNCQDSFSVNTQTATFAVADGVSQSLYPGIWAKILTKNYTDSPSDFFVLDDKQNKIPNPRMSKAYDEEFNKRFDSLSPREQSLVKITQERTPCPAATFVGVRINEKNIIVECIGDSVLFHIDNTGIHSVCSMPNKDGKIVFGNSPEYLTTDVKMQNGSVKTKEITLAPCTIFVMTDALADWFDNLDNLMDTFIGKMKSLTSHNEFVDFVSSLRKNFQLKDDDTTLMILEITDDGNPSITCTAKHVDDVISISYSEIQEEKALLKKETQQYKNEAKSLEKQLQASEEEKKKVLKLNEQQTKEISRLEKEKSDLSSQNGKLNEELKNQNNIIKNVENDIAALKNTNTNLESEIKILKSKVKIMSDKLEKAEAFKLNLSVFLKEEFRV